MTSVLALLATFAVSHIGGELLGTVLARYGLLGGRVGRLIRAARIAAKLAPLTGKTIREPDEILREWLAREVGEPHNPPQTQEQSNAAQ